MAEFGSPTTNAAWRLDVRATVGSGSWLQVKGMTDFTPAINDNVKDASTYDGGIWGADAITGRKFQLTGTLLRRNDGVSYDPGQQVIKTASDTTPPAVFEARWYQPDVTGGESYSGSVMAQWNPSGGEAQGLQSVAITLLGQGARTTAAIPTPSLAPVITLITEAGATPSLATAGGDRVAIFGTYFTGTTGVTFGGTAATNFQIESNGLIVATAPAKTAGAHNVVVTNATGASNNYSVTYA